MTQRTTRRIQVAFLGALVPLVALVRPTVASDPPPKYPFGIETRGLMTWLSLSSIREELKITPEQFGAIKAQAVAIGTDMRVAKGQSRANEQHFLHAPGELPPNPFAADAITVEGWWEGKADAALKKILSTAQFKRLQQIERQRTTPLFWMLHAALGKEKFAPSVYPKYQELLKLHESALGCLDSERTRATIKRVPREEINRLVAEKKQQIDAAYYARLLTLLTREQRERWADHIGSFYRAQGDEAQLEPNFKDLYFALLVSQDGTVELPLDPYLVLPGGETTGGEDYFEFPRSRAGTR